MTIEQIINQALIEDIGDGDHTSLATIPHDKNGKARLLVKQDGILCGMGIAKKVFQMTDSTLQFSQNLSDGMQIHMGDIAFTIEGKAISILSAERLVLNFMQRMSGIATFTYQVVNQLQGLNTKVLDTRKTTPNLRVLEKYAVKTGGGENHRFGLYDMIMIKDNHVDFAGGIENAIAATREYLLKKGKNLKIEIEARNIVEVQKIMHTGGVHRIMFDNFTPEAMKEAVLLINGKYETEASGGITLENIRQYAETGVDYISVGALTHQIKSLDMSLKAVK
ncbi:MAG: carboxylating nicotinate-nucleotide diphosphorylase [Lentimicrobiaceae bacterium]|nr:carboxylating nicotinate-nucleotide diphosphorylase [Lentimicrobiaceae bacterium]